MAGISFKCHRFPAELIREAVRLNFRFALSFRDVEELLAQREISISPEILRRWAIKFGPQIAVNSDMQRCAFAAVASRRDGLGHQCERVDLWRAVDDEGKVLDLVVRKRRNTGATLRLLKRLLRNHMWSRRASLLMIWPLTAPH